MPFTSPTVDTVIFFEDNNVNDTDMLLYGNQFSDADNYFVELSNNKKNKNIEGYEDKNLYIYLILKLIRARRREIHAINFHFPMIFYEFTFTL